MPGLVGFLFFEKQVDIVTRQVGGRAGNARTTGASYFFFEERIETDTFARSGCMKELITEVTYVA